MDEKSGFFEAIWP